MKKLLKSILIVFLALLLILGGYVAYVFLSFHRLGDQTLTVEQSSDAKEKMRVRDAAYSILSYNIGFGAYESDFGFFMDGGDRARAWDRERLGANLMEIAKIIANENRLPNALPQKDPFVLVQEVDIDSTRTYHIDERPYLTNVIPGYSSTFAQNYDSPFLFYPVTQPHGSAKSGLLTFSSYQIDRAERVELPIETGVTKLLDLDRCYSKHRILTDDGNTFVLYNLHLSAYTSDGTIVTKQLQLLIDDMDREYALGNYCVAGGDFNKDLLGNSADYFGASDREYTWAQPIPEEVLAGHPVSLVAPLNEKNPVPSCRNADGPYHEGQYVLTIDGFLVTDNVKVLSSGVVDTGFAYSDHNPVRMTFSLDRDYPEIVSSAEDADRPFRYEDSAILAQTEFDLDRDGKKENVVLAFGPTSGLFTVRLVALQDGEHRYGEIFVITPVDQPSFREKDGDLYLTFSDLSGDGTETVSFRVELIGKRIALISDNDHAYAWYWGS